MHTSLKSCSAPWRPTQEEERWSEVDWLKHLAETKSIEDWEESPVGLVWWALKTQTFCVWLQWEQKVECVWSNYRQPPAPLLYFASWRRCAVTCSVTTFSAASRSATTLFTTGLSLVKPAFIFGKAPTGDILAAISFLLSRWGNSGPANESCLSLLFVLIVKEEALDTPSLIRGSKRSLSGVSPPYAAPLSPKHLRAEAHPSEGTTFGLNQFWLS